MKILFIDTQWSGHHEKYFNCLSDHLSSSEVIGVFPKEAPLDNRIKYHVDGHSSKIDFMSYIKWLIDIKKIARKEKPDVIHFLYADYFYRFFGIFLGVFNKYHTVATFHHVKRSRLRNASIRQICKCIDECVVHTESLRDDLKELSINNINQIEYPVFFKQDYQGELPTGIENIKKTGRKILLAIGATRRDKGLDILLQALKDVGEDFYLVITGAETDIKREDIERLIEPYSDKVTVYLQFLSDAELVGFINLCDIIVLPYRKIFDGASGPLAEGVYCGKTIIGPSHGSLGKIVSDYNLGYTFESEDTFSLGNAIRRSITEEFCKTEKYYLYQNKLHQDTFVKQYLHLYNN
jgi:glycosyltransferase involved in cell wall biosynthesis